MKQSSDDGASGGPRDIAGQISRRSPDSIDVPTKVTAHPTGKVVSSDVNLGLGLACIDPAHSSAITLPSQTIATALSFYPYD